jgi:hypothetical protein
LPLDRRGVARPKLAERDPRYDDDEDEKRPPRHRTTRRRPRSPDDHRAAPEPAVRERLCGDCGHCKTTFPRHVGA